MSEALKCERRAGTRRVADLKNDEQPEGTPTLARESIATAMPLRMAREERRGRLEQNLRMRDAIESTRRLAEKLHAVPLIRERILEQLDLSLVALDEDLVEIGDDVRRRSG